MQQNDSVLPALAKPAGSETSSTCAPSPTRPPPATPHRIRGDSGHFLGRQSTFAGWTAVISPARAANHRTGRSLAGGSGSSSITTVSGSEPPTATASAAVGLVCWLLLLLQVAGLPRAAGGAATAGGIAAAAPRAKASVFGRKAAETQGKAVLSPPVPAAGGASAAQCRSSSSSKFSCSAITQGRSQGKVAVLENDGIGSTAQGNALAAKTVETHKERQLSYRRRAV